MIEGLNNYLDERGIAVGERDRRQDRVRASSTGTISISTTRSSPASTRLSCINCNKCYIACEDAAHQCIDRLIDPRGGTTLVVDEEHCVGCNLCRWSARSTSASRWCASTTGKACTHGENGYRYHRKRRHDRHSDGLLRRRRSDSERDDRRHRRLASDVGTLTVIDASGCYVFPGFIDPHTHLDMPFGGTVTADDFASGTAAAALGGTTTIVDFALHTERRLAGQRARDMGRKGRRQSVDRLRVPPYDRRRPRRDDRRDPAHDRARGRQLVQVFHGLQAHLPSRRRDDLPSDAGRGRFGGLVQVHAENGDVIEVTIKEALAAGQHRTEISCAHAARPTRDGGDVARDLARRGRRGRRSTSCMCRARGPPMRSATAASAVCRSTARPARSIWSAIPSDYDRPDFAGANYVMSPPLRDKWNQNVLIRKLKNVELQTRRLRSLFVQAAARKELGKDDFSKIPNGAPTIEDRFAILYERIGQRRRDRAQSVRRSGLDEPGQALRALSAQGHDRGRQRRRHRRLGSAKRAHDLGGDASHEGRQQHLRGHDRAWCAALRVLARALLVEGGTYVGETGRGIRQKSVPFPPRAAIARNDPSERHRNHRTDSGAPRHRAATSRSRFTSASRSRSTCA